MNQQSSYPLKNHSGLSEEPGPAQTTIGEDIDDTPITSQVKMTMLYHRSTSAFNAKVEIVMRSHVRSTLSSTVRQSVSYGVIHR